MLEGFNSSAATFAADIDNAFWIHIGISFFLFMTVVGPMFYFAWKYREDKVKNEDIGTMTHNIFLEITWTVIPVGFLMLFFYYGYSTMRTLRTMPAESESIVVHMEGKKWSWMHTYAPNKSGFVHKSAELYVPIDTNIIIKMTAPVNDVIHSYFVPAFRMKEDVVPGRLTKQWFKSEVIGNYDVECAEYCGTRHSYMLTKIHVISKAEYDAWFESNAKFPGAPTDTKMSKGQELFDANGCSGCHSTDSDAILVGPSLKGIGAKYDANYLKDAILKPAKDVPAGFTAGIMQPYSLSDSETAELVKYINTLK